MEKQLYIKDIKELFDAVQQSQVFEDQKTMTDAVPLYSISEINRKFNHLKNNPDFNLRNFVNENFDVHETEIKITRTEKLPIQEHIEKLWDELTRTSNENIGTLLKLPKPYIVPGGRFNEFFYWDSFYVMLGLQVSGKTEMMQNIVENCAYLIQNFGFVPNASRTHFLSRSQPPYFSLMLEMIFKNTNDGENIYLKHFETLEKEYQFWMNGAENLKPNEAFKRVVCVENETFLNRYFDDENEPRPESYLIDFEDFKKAKSKEFYRNIRAACESGWDFSSRWFADNNSIETINTLDLVQVDLNCLLWHTENLLAQISELKADATKASSYKNKAENRKNAIQKYFWDETFGIYRDYNFVEKNKTVSEHIATLYPLFFKISEEKQAKLVSEKIETLFLKPGGLITTTKESGQQWDSPNAWAPYQWLGYHAMKNYGFDDLAKKIKNNWCDNVERVYESTGKIMEKYNAIDTESLAGGGEYPNQDGFGWTNGVYLQFKKNKN